MLKFNANIGMIINLFFFQKGKIKNLLLMRKHKLPKPDPMLLTFF